MKFGYHIKLHGGPLGALEEAMNLGCDTMQIFPGNPGQWGTPHFSDEEIQNFRSLKERASIDPVFIHSIYLVNMASPVDAVWKRSVGSLVSALVLAERLGALGVVAHSGNHKGEGLRYGLERIANAVLGVFERAEGKAMLLLETTAGAGTSIGGKFEEFGEIFRITGWPERLGFCLDTCHIFAAGYDISTEEGIEKTLEELDANVGLERLKLLHLNDSKGECGSNLDRHEHIGKGRIGLEAFKFLVNHGRLKSLPAIAELEYESGAKDIEILRGLVS